MSQDKYRHRNKLLSLLPPPYLNLTPISLELMSLAVDSMTPPNKPPPLRPPRPPPIISADLLIM